MDKITAQLLKELLKISLKHIKNKNKQKSKGTYSQNKASNRD